ncbi:MAG: DNRLRE domain-containing protein [Anaerolineales bacterium]|nr:DNRLRE domain-containing protein [Anaerolineales bacterium]
MKQISIAVSFSLLLLILLVTSVTADLTLEPSDDTYIDINKPDLNLNSAKLILDYSNIPACYITRRAFLRFDLTSISQDIGSDTYLRLYVEHGPGWNGNLVIRSVSDDWNGSASGNGDETTLTWSNAPAPGDVLDTQSIGATGDFIIFSSSALSTHINNQRSDHGGDDTVSFVIEWSGCVTLFDNIILEDKDDTGGTGYSPELRPFTPTAVLLTTMSAKAPDELDLWPIFCLLFVTTIGLLLIMRIIDSSDRPENIRTRR